jgi:hypothetical protein
MVDWIIAIGVNALIVYACYKFVTFGMSGGFQRLFSKKKKKNDVNSGQLFG